MSYLDGPLPKRAQTDATTVAGGPTPVPLPPSEVSGQMFPPHRGIAGQVDSLDMASVQSLYDSLRRAFGTPAGVTLAQLPSSVAGDYESKSDSIYLNDEMGGSDLRATLMHEFGHKYDATDPDSRGSHSPGYKAFIADSSPVGDRPEEAFADGIQRAWMGRTGEQYGGATGYPELAKFITPPRAQVIDSEVGAKMGKIIPTVKDYFAR